MFKNKIAKLKFVIAELYIEPHYRDPNSKLWSVVKQFMDAFYRYRGDDESIKNEILDTNKENSVYQMAYEYIAGSSREQINLYWTLERAEEDVDEAMNFLPGDLINILRESVDYLINEITDDDYNNYKMLRNKISGTIKHRLDLMIKRIVFQNPENRSVIDLQNEIKNSLMGMDTDDKLSHNFDVRKLMDKASKSSSLEALESEVGNDVKEAYDNYVSAQMNHKFNFDNGRISFSFKDIFGDINSALGYGLREGASTRKYDEFMNGVADKINGDIQGRGQNSILRDQTGKIISKPYWQAFRRHFIATYDEFVKAILGGYNAKEDEETFDTIKDDEYNNKKTVNVYNEKNHLSPEEIIVSNEMVNIWDSLSNKYMSQLGSNLNRLDGFLSGFEIESQQVKNRIDDLVNANNVLKKLFKDEYRNDIIKVISDINNALIFYTIAEYFKNMMNVSSSEEVEDAFMNAIKASSGNVNLSALYRFFEQVLNRSGLNKDDIIRRILDVLGKVGEASKVSLGFINSEGQFSARLKQLIVSVPTLKEWIEDDYKVANSFIRFIKTASCYKYLRDVKIKILFNNI